MIVAAVLGGLFGARLAARGLTAANALDGRQVPAYLILASLGLLVFLLWRGPQLAWVPDLIAVYGDTASLYMAPALLAFAIGLLIALEWPGRRDPKRRRQLAIAALVLAIVGSYIGFRALPPPFDPALAWVQDGVVLQSTPYTCAPATIATLLRWFAVDTAATELSVATLAGTTRQGTTTRRELDVMRRVGLAPRYARFLNVDSLVADGRPALLHVNEPLRSGATIRHAVALLDIDHAARTVLLGNPLLGLQTKRFDELRGYWTGEALFVTTRDLAGGGEQR